MNDIPLSILFFSLLLLVIVSGFFSGSETGLMSLNRYRLKHLADKKHKGAQRAQRLLETPDRLIGLILLGNNMVNILASAIATIIGIRLLGDYGFIFSTIALTLVILVFAEVTPKTLAAMYPERFALPSSFILSPMLKVLYPLVWFINLFTRLIFKILGISTAARSSHDLNSEELRIVVNEASTMIPHQHQQMLLSILDLEKVTVEDIMVPRNEITGINLNDDWNNIVSQMSESLHTRLPVFQGDIDHIVGIIHIRHALHLFHKENTELEDLKQIIHDAYFVPVGTPLNTQLLNFQKARRRIGLVVNEYGDIQGLVTLEDILEEIVGEFTTDPSAMSKDVHLEEDGSYLVDGSATVRELNRVLGWELPTEGPKTLNGLILEYLETIPDPGTSLLIADYPLEIVQTSQSSVKTVRIHPDWKQSAKEKNAED
ncbi:MAG: HlyC/CorC family transporter [Gammaproteobacteria bacterium]|nr:HlyC/CorC family transporter [Gammaproteobacteria bacterium]MDH5778159.1 HlyC/CorC family transporter [Gammaproteobacteria bacterium]